MYEIENFKSIKRIGYYLNPAIKQTIDALPNPIIGITNMIITEVMDTDPL
jgi:hypothetical protein